MELEELIAEVIGGLNDHNRFTGVEVVSEGVVRFTFDGNEYQAEISLVHG